MSTTKFGLWNCRGIRTNWTSFLDDQLDRTEDSQVDVLFACETKAYKGSNPLRGRGRWIDWKPTEEENLWTTMHGTGIWIKDSFQPHRIRVLNYGTPGHSCWLLLDKTWLIGCIYIRPEIAINDARKLLKRPEGYDKYPLILMGDLNANFREHTGLSREKGQACKLRPILEEMHLEIVSTLKGHPTRRDDATGKLSHLDSVWTDAPGIITIPDDKEIGSTDHFLLTTTIPTTYIKPPMAAWRPNWGRVDWAIYKENSLFFTPIGTAWNGDNKEQVQSWLDHESSDITNLMMTEGKKLGGMTRPGIRKDSTPKDITLNNLKKERNRIFKECIEHQEPSKESLSTYKRIRQLIRRRLFTLREQGFKEFGERLAKMPAHEITKVTASIRKKHNRAGCALPTNEEGMTTTTNFFASQFAIRDWQPTQPPEWTSPGRPPTIEETTEIHTLVSANGIFDIARHVTPRKAPGLTGLPNEALRNVHKKSGLWTRIAKLFHTCLIHGIIPTTWKQAAIFPVYKKGDRHEVSNYRPICLTEALRKLFERTIMSIMTQETPRLKLPLHPYQGGFRPKRSTLDQAAALDETMRQFDISRKRPPVVVYLDIKAAYDTVLRWKLWQKMEAKGIAPWLINICQTLFDDNTLHVTMGGLKGNAIQHETGLMQGSILSPQLYAFYINDLCEEFEQQATLTHARLRTSAFFYADDIAVVCDNMGHAQRILNLAHEYATRNGFQFAPTKCEYSTPVDRMTLTLGTEPILRCTKFKYLGIWFDEKGINWKDHIDWVSQKAKRSSVTLVQSGITTYGMGSRIARLAFTVIARPALEYGIQIANMTKLLWSKWYAAHSKCLTMMMAGSPTMGTATPLHYLRITPPETRAGYLKANWTWRIQQLPNGRKPEFVAAALRDSAITFWRASRRKKSTSCFTNIWKPTRFDHLRQEAEHGFTGSIPEGLHINEHSNAWAIAKLVDTWRTLEHMWDEKQSLALRYMCREPGRSAQLVERICDRRMRYLAEQIITRRLIRKPIRCDRCNSDVVQEHLDSFHHAKMSELLPAGHITDGVLSALQALKAISGQDRTTDTRAEEHQGDTEPLPHPDNSYATLPTQQFF